MAAIAPSRDHRGRRIPIASVLPMPRSLIALGANLGDRQQTLDRAVRLLAADPGIKLATRSRWHETAPIGGIPGQGPFLNGAVLVNTTLASDQLHALVRRVETELGRTRAQRWAARTVDIDLLLYGDEVILRPELVVPHPRMSFRRFVLEPAAEIAPDLVHPTIGWTIAALLAHLTSASPYVALLGPPGSGKRVLAQSIASQLGGRFIADDSSLGEPSASDPPSRALERQLQFLVRRAALLDRGHWQQPDMLAISDFYFDQTLAYGRACLSSDDYAAWHRAWEQARAGIVAPKLLVVLDDFPSRWLAAPSSTPPSRNVDAEMLELAMRRGVGPVLFAGRADRASQLEEITAAIAAMQ
jgi:2-amino-4-hydroxy-6-hydroxymethyldihydropteridine diphosphokinase